MPLLAKECTLFPANLFEDDYQPQVVADDVEKPEKDEIVQWFAVYTKARQEKALARELHENETPFFLPLVPSPRKIRGKVQDAFLPLFSGYVFVHATRRDVYRHLATKRISMILEVEEQDQFRQELGQLARLMESDVRMNVEAKLVKGDEVRVRNGAFKGLSGTVVRRHGKDCILVAVTYLGQGVSVEIEDFCVDKV